MNNKSNSADRFGGQIGRFFRTESAGGIVLVIAAVLAMAVKNSPLSEFYGAFLNIEGGVRLGALSVEKPLFLWVNDFQMAIFFFLIGLEIKKEVLHGHLSDAKQMLLPVAGAIGGVLVPALIYIAFNAGDPGAIIGWAVPTATDIAFALGVLALLGPRVPSSLKIFLMTLAIIDDLVAIVIIAIFYTSGLSTISLASASVFLVLLAVLNRLRVTHIAAYILVGLGLWLCVLKSGVHATLAGVITALFIPSIKNESEQKGQVDALIEALHPWIAFGVLPLFAFVNAGIDFSGLNLGLLIEPIPLGIALGLVVGKPLGVLFFTAIILFAGFSKMPDGVRWVHFVGVGFLCGIGFTMSLFIGGLAFAEGGAGYARIDRLGMLVGSLSSAIIGYLILRYSLSKSAAPQGYQAP